MHDYMHQTVQWGSGASANGFAGHSALIIGALAFLAPLIIIAVCWSLFWKGLALWHAARRGQYWWFIIMLVLNTLGILEIIYLFFVAKLSWSRLFSLHSDDMHEHRHHEHSGHGA